MFEDALLESGKKITTHRTWFSGVAAICNCSIACLLVLWPLLHPASLPRLTLSMVLAAPAPPAPLLAHMPRVVSVATRAAAFANPFTAPKIIPNSIANADREPPPVDMGLAPLAREGGGSFISLPDSIGNAEPPQVHVAPSKKLAISSGVMAGNKLSGVEPRYPAIARAARVQGTVVLAASISKTGTIENLHVVSGPPMLAMAAEGAVRTWHYRPYQLNGAPVEVETTVRVVFHLGG
ncbi:MAG: periplasmic protein TonB [Acidobacteriaceae bacterium]|jgi:protein TonB|nr:periplasmic protein TonB [Acidobacteriaceae bacterium]